MKSSPHSPGVGVKADRHGLDSEPAGGMSAVPGLSERDSQQRAAPDSDAAAPDVFEDLRRRNERRARLAHLRRHAGR
ncbi:MAG: hypothetical protein ACXVH1_09960 [Solirubrobacteraceae bacterium]